MATDIGERENLQNELKKKHICRFCLTTNKLTNIFARDGQASLAPLPVQVMACASIEVFTNDGMPAWICKDCRILFEHSYRFKQMCKRADTLLRQFPLTGEWPRPLEKPKIPQTETKKAHSTSTATSPIITAASTLPMKQSLLTVNAIHSKKILNSSPAAVPEPPAPIRSTLKKETLNDDLDIIFNKDGCNELSMEDVQRLIANVGDDEEFQSELPVKRPPKVLNKASMRILNKEANVIIEPKLSVPKVKLDEDGNVIVTAVIDPIMKNEKLPDPVKNAEPIATDVYPCPQCDRSFPLLQLRDIHMVNHNRERRFQCPNCDKSFFSKYDLQKHEVRHTGEKPFKCVVCMKGFSRATLLHRHEKVHTEIPKYLCVHCEKAFLSKEEMQQHTARHEKNRPFKCRVCQKTFAFKQGLERHESVHSSVQPYPCQYCDQSFPTPSKLARHLTAHAGKRPYPCKYCSKSYVLSHHLTRHMRSHKQVKASHTCTECNKEFKTRDELIYHSAVHSTVSLVCTLCLTKLSSAEEVTEHLKEHVDGDAYACEFCDLIFLKANALVAHSQEKHAKEMAVYNADTTSNQKTRPSSADVTLEPLEEHMIEETEDISTHEVEYIDEVEEEDDHNDNNDDNNDDHDHNDDDDEEGEEEENVNSKTSDSSSPDKPKIVNQIILSSSKDLKYFLLPKEEKGNSNSDTKSLTRNTTKNDQQSAAKRRKIISVDGRLKEVECPPEDTSPQKRKVVVLAEKKVEVKVENENKNSSNAANSSAQRKSASSTSESTVISNRRSNETKTTTNIKIEEPPKKIIRKAVLKSTTSASATTSASTTDAKKETPPRVKQIRMTKSQAEALTKQGRIQFKDGNMILTKEAAQPTRASKRAK